MTYIEQVKTIAKVVAISMLVLWLAIAVWMFAAWDIGAPTPEERYDPNRSTGKGLGS